LRVRELRVARHWSQGKLAERLVAVGLILGQSNVARLENGKRDVSLVDLYGLALALDCPPLFLLAPNDDNAKVRVGKRGENPSRLRAWVVGKQPLDTVRDPDAYREHAGQLDTVPDPDFHQLAAGRPSTRRQTEYSAVLRHLADVYDAGSDADRADAELAVLAYTTGVLKGRRMRRRSRTTAPIMASFDVSEWTPDTKRRRNTEQEG